MVRLRSLHLTLDSPEDEYLGMLYLDADASAGGVAYADRSGSVLIRIAASPLPPGYVLTYADGTPAVDRADPVVVEADRLIRTILQPADDVARREHVIRHVLTTPTEPLLLEDPIWQRDCWRYVRGELDRPAFLTATRQAQHRLSEEAPFWPFATQHTIADTWQHDSYHRHDAYLLDTSIDVAETASRLHRTLDDVEALITQRELLALDVGARTRIPTWQLHPHSAEDSDEEADSGDATGPRWELLPGLPVLLAAMPASWADTAGSTNFMTTPNLALADEPSGPMELRHPVSPVEWITTGRPLADVIRLLRTQP